MGQMAGKVAVISGAARGMGRAHAVTLAREGADVVAFDVCEPLQYPTHLAATPEDLAETRRLVEKEGRRCLAVRVDARDLASLGDLADSTMREFGRVDALVVNHAIWVGGIPSWDLEAGSWQESIDVILGGAWKMTTAFIPKMIEARNGGAITLISSAMGAQPQPGGVAYTTAKHGIIGLMRTLSWELGAYSIRANTVSPGGVDTEINHGDTHARGHERFPRFFTTQRSLLPVDWLAEQDIANAVCFLSSDQAIHITGINLPVDAGWSNF